MPVLGVLDFEGKKPHGFSLEKAKKAQGTGTDNIIVVGNGGTGKTSLIASLCGFEVSEKNKYEPTHGTQHSAIYKDFEGRPHQSIATDTEGQKALENLHDMTHVANGDGENSVDAVFMLYDYESGLSAEDLCKLLEMTMHNLSFLESEHVTIYVLGNKADSADAKPRSFNGIKKKAKKLGGRIEFWDMSVWKNWVKPERTPELRDPPEMTIEQFMDMVLQKSRATYAAVYA